MKLKMSDLYNLKPCFLVFVLSCQETKFQAVPKNPEPNSAGSVPPSESDNLANDSSNQPSSSSSNQPSSSTTRTAKTPSTSEPSVARSSDLCASAPCWDSLKVKLNIAPPNQTPTPVPQNTIISPVCSDVKDKQAKLTGGRYDDDAQLKQELRCEVYAATKNGIVEGDAPTSGNRAFLFQPSRNLTRAEMTTMILESLKCLKNIIISPDSEYPKLVSDYVEKRKEKHPTTYDDIRGDEWYTAPIYEATIRGIIKGYGQNNGTPKRQFGPIDSVTYGQLCRMIYTSIVHVYSKNINQQGLLLKLQPCLFQSEDGIMYPNTMACLAEYTRVLGFGYGYICGPHLSGIANKPARREEAAVMVYRMKKSLIVEQFHLEGADLTLNTGWQCPGR